MRRSKAHARRMGWVGPFAYDDETIDDPAAQPATADAETTVDDMAVELAVSGDKPTLTVAERHLAVERLWRSRWGDPRVAAHLGVSSKTVARDRDQLNLPAWNQNDLDDERQVAA